MSIGILGGGLAGLALKRFLPGAEVLEAEAIPGGLCRSYRKDGFCYDVGGHILFSKDRDILALIAEILGDNAAEHYRRNVILFRGRFVRYPFENGLPDLPLPDRLACLWRYVRRPRAAPRNFAEWIVARFGRGIADRYLTPYNEKIWKTPLADISTGWVDRVPDPPLLDIAKGALGIRTEGYLHQLHFTYPKSGGIQALTDALASGDGVATDFRVRRVARDGGGWAVGDGKRERRYERLVSTIPVPDLLEALEGVPADVREAAAGLRFNSIIVVMVGIEAPTPPPHLAVYVPQRDAIFHRVCFNRFFGEAYAPSGCASISAEITLPPGDRLLSLPEAAIEGQVIDGLRHTGLIARDARIVATDVRKERYAYVVDTHDRKARMEKIRRHLSGLGIALCGRFAEFEYLNMDACLARARDLARSLA